MGRNSKSNTPPAAPSGAAEPDTGTPPSAATTGDSADQAPLPDANPTTPGDAELAGAQHPEAPDKDLASRMGDVSELYDRSGLAQRLQLAVQESLDAMDEFARGTAFIITNPVDASLVEAARLGFDAVRKAMADAQEAIGKAAEMVRYQDLERREFALIKDVELDGARFGPSYDLRHAPLTEAQHAELKAVCAVVDAWDEGARQEGPAQP